MTQRLSLNDNWTEYRKRVPSRFQIVDVFKVEVCREFLRQSCKRDNTECKYAHPSSNVDIQNGKVTVCFDAFKVSH